jgi:hypothetical protein
MWQNVLDKQREEKNKTQRRCNLKQGYVPKAFACPQSLGEFTGGGSVRREGRKKVETIGPEGKVGQAVKKRRGWALFCGRRVGSNGYKPLPMPPHRLAQGQAVEQQGLKTGLGTY